MVRFSAKFAETNLNIGAAFGEMNLRMDAQVNGEVYIVHDPDLLPEYTGVYEVVPRVEAQTLPTAEKYLERDVSIKAIPIYDVTNATGGTTIYIAKEID